MGKFVNGAMSPHKIYEYFANGRGTETLDDAQAATRNEWQLEDDRAGMIRRQGELIRDGWQGTASEGAFGAAQPLRDSAVHGADMLSRAEDLLDRQSGSFHRAANDVQPVPAEPPGLELNDSVPFTTDYEAQVREYQAGAQHNMDVYRGYDGASEYNQTNMPEEYSTVNHSGGTISVVSPDSGDYIEVSEHEDPRRGGESGPNGPGGPGFGGPGPGGPGGPPGGGPSGSGPVPSPWPPQQTSPNDYVPPAAHGPGYPSPNPYQPTPQPTPGPGQGGYLPGTFTGGPGGGGSGPGGSRGGGAGPRGGAYGGSGGNPGPGAGGRGATPGAGPGSGAIAAEEAAARRAAAAAASRSGAPGGMGGAPVGGGKGKGDEDEEHQRKVLLEIDAEGVFGSDVLTAPQVIGDDAYEDD